MQDTRTQSPSVDELDLPFAPERVDYRVQRVPDDAVAAFDPAFASNSRHHVRDFPCHPTLLPVNAGQNRAPSLSGLARLPSWVAKQSADPFFMDISRPRRSKDPCQSQVHQQIAQLGRIKDIRVIECGEAGHESQIPISWS